MRTTRRQRTTGRKQRERKGDVAMSCAGNGNQCSLPRVAEEVEPKKESKKLRPKQFWMKFKGAGKAAEREERFAALTDKERGMLRQETRAYNAKIQA